MDFHKLRLIIDCGGIKSDMKLLKTTFFSSKIKNFYEIFPLTWFEISDG